MKTVSKQLMEMILDRELALERMQDEFDAADNNPFVQSGAAKSISDLTDSIEELQRFYEISKRKDLK